MNINKVFLCGHTGSLNRGCEAIVRSTVNLLHRCDIDDITLFTFGLDADLALNLDSKLRLLPYPHKNLLLKARSFFYRKFLNKKNWGNLYLYRKLLEHAENDSLFFNIGGDTYCYGSPLISYGLNDVAQEKDIPNIFWGCSVDESALANSAMIEDLNKYSYIVVRDCLSWDILKQCVRSADKILKTCDPAFHLEMKPTDLPTNFMVGNTLGLNLSPMIFKDADDVNDIVYQNVYSLIDYVLAQTNMNICLIPHVYDMKSNLQDIAILKKIFEHYNNNDRVSIVDKDLSCTELKFIISKCRFFIGARTHAVIAAYSTEVPCLALSYSIKSRGIAKDLFGTDIGYALSYEKIAYKDEIRDVFIKFFLNNEQKIKRRYTEILPSYKQSIVDAMRFIVGGAYNVNHK